MSTFDHAAEVLKTFLEERLRAFVTLFGDEDAVARMECDILANDPNAKTYSSFQEFMKEMEAETQ